MLLQHLEQGRGEEGRGGRAGADVLHTERQQGEQNDDGFLLEPGEHQGQRQIVDAALERVGERQGQLDGGVGIIALTGIQQAVARSVDPLESAVRFSTLRLPAHWRRIQLRGA